MKGARWRAGAGVGNGPRGLLSEDKLSPENIYKIYHEAIKESSEEQSKKFKERFKEKFNEGSNIITQDQFSIISIFEEMFKKRVEAITQDQFSEIFSDEKIDLLFDQLNSANLEEHLSMINQKKWKTYNSKAEIEKSPQENYPEPPRESWGEETYKKLCFSCYSYRSRNLKDQPKNLTELLKKINPYCDPSEEKIKKVLEEYKIYKELHSDEEDLQKKQECKAALKQAINDALKTNMLIRPTIDLAKSISAKHDLEEKINLALNSQSANPPNPGSEGIEINLVSWDQPSESKSISPDALESILFHNKVEIITPKRKLKSVKEFKNFLAENGGTSLNENKVKEAFDAYKIYYNATLIQSDILVKLTKSEEIQSKGVSNDEFDKILGFIYGMPKVEGKKQDKGEKEIVMVVEELKEFKKKAITEKLRTWCSINNTIYANETYQAYENYANASEQEKPALEAIVLSKLTVGDREGSEFLKILDIINEYHDISIANYEKKARGKVKQEEPNEIIKFFFEDLPNTILSVFDCIRSSDSSNKGSGSSNRRE